MRFYQLINIIKSINSHKRTNLLKQVIQVYLKNNRNHQIKKFRATLKNLRRHHLVRGKVNDS